jgi:hypothetical protein
MVSLPLFRSRTGFEANGVQMGNLQYNPSDDGILWNVAALDDPQAGPAGRSRIDARELEQPELIRRECRARRQVVRASPSRRATMPVAPVTISEPLRRSGGIGRRASLRG